MLHVLPVADGAPSSLSLSSSPSLSLSLSLPVIGAHLACLLAFSRPLPTVLLLLFLAESLLAELEQHYYSSAHKGQPPRQEQDAQSSKLAELCAQALQMTGG